MSTISTRAGPVATRSWLTCGARDVHGVGWSTIGEFGWLVTALTVAAQFAAAAAASSTVAGAAARARKPASRRGSMRTSTNGSASSTSGCTATAAPISQADRTVRPERDSARMPYSSSATASASSGWPQRTETFHSTTAPAAARNARLSLVTLRCSAIASAANSTTDDSRT